MPKKKTQEEFDKEIKKFTLDEYIFTENYISGHTKINIKHIKCGFEYKVTPTKFKGGKRCPRCAKCERMDTESFKDKVRQIVEDEYCVSGSYENNKKHILMTHTICNSTYKVSPDMFLNKGRRCPSCSTSINSTGVKVIKQYLNNNSIRFVQEKIFDEFKKESGRNYRFDFFIEELNLVIEYDGIQHFKPVKRWGGEDYLKSVQSSDLIKNNFCKSNSIDILRIDYTKNEAEIKKI